MKYIAHKCLPVFFVLFVMDQTQLCLKALNIFINNNLEGIKSTVKPLQGQ